MPVVCAAVLRTLPSVCSSHPTFNFHGQMDIWGNTLQIPASKPGRQYVKREQVRATNKPFIFKNKYMSVQELRSTLGKTRI